jgi:hypothetical protein
VVGGVGLGLLGLVICGWGAGGEVDLSDQIRWLLGGILSVAVASLSLAYWLYSGLRTVRLEAGRVLRSVVPLGHLSGSGGTALDRNSDVTSELLVTAPGMKRYHGMRCPLVAGKAVHAVGPAEIAEAKLRPCGACQA